jgi:Protein of unknown function (DUF1592)/Protein of unknown function (DUF1588)/Protein of unknown function (DUF1587)/Protein of unknown function (DUF1585)/Protein of unknown function (DUF1595)/Planctomycete cytochrome C
MFANQQPKAVRRYGFSIAMLSAMALVFSPSLIRANETDFAQLEKSFQSTTFPLVKQYCAECHSPELAEAEIDLVSIETFAGVRQSSMVWQRVAEMLHSGQMPPKDATQPSDDERAKLKSWVDDYLKLEARTSAGDPGRVVLRRLNNAEYTYTLRDLTGIASLQPAREFPGEGAAGEGFTNTGNSLVMSPALVTKYLDAAKQVAEHAVLLPDGFRFSTGTSRSDWSNEILADIRSFYNRYTVPTENAQVTLQGLTWETNDGGMIPLEKYLQATIAERQAISAGTKTWESVAQERGLSAKYLHLVWLALANDDPSPLFATLRNNWQRAKPDDAAGLAAHIARWQQTLWKFQPVGHIGKVGGPKSWQEFVSPLQSRQEIRLTIPTTSESPEVTLYLAADDAGDGKDGDQVVFDEPRFIAAGRPDLLLRDVRPLTNELKSRRMKMFDETAKCLDAAMEVQKTPTPADIPSLAARYQVDADSLAAWLDYLGIGAGAAMEIRDHFSNKIESSAGYDFAKGWGTGETPNMVANSSDQHVRIPGNLKPHSVAVHPSPTLNVVMGWQSPVKAATKISGVVQHAHPECGNGVTWTVELRRGRTRQQLASGISQGATEVPFGPIENVNVLPGDVIALIIGPRDGNHACDLTAVNINLTDQSDASHVWDLAADVSPDVLAGNPHADRLGNRGVWHFFTEPIAGSQTGPVIPVGSLLDKWLAAGVDDERQQIALQIQSILTGQTPAAADSPDAQLVRQLNSLGGPLFRAARAAVDTARKSGNATNSTPTDSQEFGLPDDIFGKSTDGQPLAANALCIQAPQVLAIKAPFDLVAGTEFVTSGSLLTPKDPANETAQQGSVQFRAQLAKLEITQSLHHDLPIITREASLAHQRFSKSINDFAELFPAATCYTRIVPVDEVVTLTLYYREDDRLCRLMLTDDQKSQLDRLWDELHYVSHDAVALVDAFEQLMQYATQDADPTVFAPLRKPIQDRAAAFKDRLVATEPAQIDALIDFASRAYRRPLSDNEKTELRKLYQRLRSQEMPHDDAFRLTLARIFVAPAFLYRLEQPQETDQATPVSDWELANRLSYFLWSSMPDDELMQLAAQGKLHERDVLLEQMHRMVRDPRARRLATEFACQWAHIYEFDQLNEKSETHFPSFASLRSDMYEESIQFFTSLFQNNESVLDLLDAKHTFLNEPLAKYYGIPNVTGNEWRRVENVRQYSRGGILTQASTLAKQSGASRTSPILRGNWICEVLLGDKLPKPPKNVPVLPETPPDGLTERQLIEKHTSDPACAKCHARIDPLGFSLENFDAIGGFRDKSNNSPINAKAVLMDGTNLNGVDGLRQYLLTQRRNDFLRQFCKKLLGYSLARSIQLSDEPLLDKMQDELAKNDYRIMTLLETIVTSDQFLKIRGSRFQ